MSTGALFSKVLLTLKTNSQRTAQVFFILFSEGHATAREKFRKSRENFSEVERIFFEAKRKNFGFCSGLREKIRDVDQF